MVKIARNPNRSPRLAPARFRSSRGPRGLLLHSLTGFPDMELSIIVLITLLRIVHDLNSITE